MWLLICIFTFNIFGTSVSQRNKSELHLRLTSNKENNSNWEAMGCNEIRNIEKCKAEKVCPDYDQECKDGVSWENLTRKIVKMNDTVEVVDMTAYPPLIQKMTGFKDIEKYKEENCHIAFVALRGKNECRVWHTQNWCPWITKLEYNYRWGQSYAETEKKVPVRTQV